MNEDFPSSEMAETLQSARSHQQLFTEEDDAFMSKVLRRQNLPIEIASASTADEVCKRLKGVFEAFMSSLKSDEEVGLILASFGVSYQLSVENLWSLGPNLIRIDGYEENTKVSLIQHISQLSFLLVPLKVDKETSKPRRKIGFYLE